MSFLNLPVNNVIKNRRIPNAFMLFVKEQKKVQVQSSPDGNKSMSALGAVWGKKWRSMTPEEKQVYYEKYKTLKKSKIDNSDYRLVKDEEHVKSKNIPKTDANEMVIGSNSNVVFLHSGTKTEKDMIKPKSNESYSTDVAFGNETCEVDPKPSTTTDYKMSKQQSCKKVRRTPNAFLLFAKEQRNSLDPTFLKANKSQVSTLLGRMWNDLPDSKKEKYKLEANHLFKMHKRADCATTSSETEKSIKKKMKKRSKRPVGRPSKKSKKIHLVATPTASQMSNGMTTGQKEAASDSVKHTVKVESSGATQVTAACEPQNSNDYPNVSHRHSNFVASHFQHIPAPVEPQHNACFNCRRPESTDTNNCNTSSRQNPVPDTNIARSCFSSGMGYSPSLFPAYPFNASPFWMYHHAMSHYMPYYPLSNISQSLCNCAFPYPAYPNSYFSSYITGISERCNSSFPSASSSAVATSNSNKNDSVDASNNDHSGDELLIIDEDPEGKKALENDTAHCE